MRSTAAGDLNVPHPLAIAAAAQARMLHAKGGLLFDGWNNDLRDNECRGAVDGARERGAQDGQHFGRVYNEFCVNAGSYEGGGWDFLPPPPPVVVPETRRVEGQIQYVVCVDVVVMAYRNAGVQISAMRSTGQLLDWFRRNGHVWQGVQNWPPEYLPGDLVATFSPGHGGHSTIVIEKAPTRDASGNLVVPIVVEIPGPSTQRSDRTYDPASSSDVRLGPLSPWRLEVGWHPLLYIGRYFGTPR